MFNSIHAASHGRARRRINALGSLVVPNYSRRLHWYHRQIAEALEGALRFVRYRGKRGGYARVMISMPPRHGKSLHATELFPALGLGVDPDLKFMAATNGAELAREGIKNARNWMQNEEYLQTFATRVGKVESIDASGKSQGYVDNTDAAQMMRTLKPKRPGSQEYEPGLGYYMAQGIGGSLTGRGFEIGILDDLIKNYEQANSPRYHAKVWSWYTSTFDTRANDEFAAQIFIGTRWLVPDFADELLDFWAQLRAGGVPLPIKVLRFSALAEAPLEDGDPRQIGEGLDKPPPHGKMSTDAYLARRDALLSQTPEVWHGLWQQRPQKIGHKFFQPDSWVHYPAWDLAGLDYVDFSVDTNLSETGQSKACISVFGVMSDRNSTDGRSHYFLLDESRGSYSLDTIESELIRLAEKWSQALPRQFYAGKWWVENKALGPTIINKYRGEFPIVAVGKIKAKLYCYRVASTVTGQQCVYVPAESFGKDPTNPNLPLVDHTFVGSGNEEGSWVHEQKSYPSKPDDRRDTLAMQIICRTPWLGPDWLNRKAG